ncbi:class I SAM-dependent methyltransferase [Fodinibius sediminis]|uniref:Methyltransferase domain-containing protein n=1 Tax=Fodinibius sediminis TaxID=1214077 RepID=A0A521DXK3_9BACT|nr:class I SAM-dependent methyltransferase [Fodinibius sediminis]SMO76464.1 Methyltransferase domain-containing protein [Fodinibius sediminis]
MSDRRRQVPFDPYYFEKQKQDGRGLSMQETFSEIHHNNHWQGAESVSGEGSSRSQTDKLARKLPELLKDYDIDSMLDLPCGDFSWMKHLALPLTSYIGADIVPELIAENKRRYGSEQRSFVMLDLTADPLPATDLLFCRDCLVHFSYADIHKALANIRSHAIGYLLTTTFPSCESNEDITTGDWRPLNLQAEPFNLPEPLMIIREDCTEGKGLYRDKSLALWKISKVLL